MMFTSAAGRRALLNRTAMRSFSSGLLVPLATRADPPAELQATPLSDAAHANLLESYAQFNEACKGELQEMNKNIIENIVARGGTEGWDTDMYAMKKKFEFDSFEECQAFVMRVAIDAEKKDHHPEWHTMDGGRTVNVTLTSHFAQNTVTRLDFELAECMNNAYTETRGSFKMYPWFTKGEWASIKIGAVMAVFTMFSIKFLVGNRKYEEVYIEPAPMPSTNFESTVGALYPVQALADESSKVEVIDYAYGDYEKKENTRPIAGM